MKLKTLYTVNELAAMCGFRNRRMRNWIARENVPVVQSGRSVVIPLAAFRDAFPQVWESIVIRYNLRPAACSACGQRVDPLRAPKVGPTEESYEANAGPAVDDDQAA